MSNLYDARTSPIAPLPVFLDLDEGLVQKLFILEVVFDEQNFEDSWLWHLRECRAGGLCISLLKTTTLKTSTGLDGELVFLKLAVQSCPADPKQVGGDGAVPFCIFQGFEDGSPFDLGQRNDR